MLILKFCQNQCQNFQHFVLILIMNLEFFTLAIILILYIFYEQS